MVYAICLLIALTLLLSRHTFSEPLDADAGRHMYYALFRKKFGNDLYKNLTNGKPPGMLFTGVLLHWIWPGERGYRVQQSFLRCMSSVAVLFAAQRFMGFNSAVIAALLYSAMVSVPYSRAQFSHAENWHTLFSCLIVCFAGNPHVALVLVALSCMYKQTGAAYIALAPVVCLGAYFEPHIAVWFTVVSLGITTICLYVLPWGYVRRHWTRRTVKEELALLYSQFRKPWVYLWPVIVLAMAACFMGDTRVVGWLALTVVVGLSQRHYAVHHFLPCLPPLAILAATTVQNHSNDPLTWVILVIFAAGVVLIDCACAGMAQSSKLIRLWGAFGFMSSAAKEVGLHIKSRTDEDDKVLQIGDQTTVNYYSERSSPWHKQHWIYPEPSETLAQDLADCINHQKPKYLVFMNPLAAKYISYKVLGPLLTVKYNLECSYSNQVTVYRKKG